MTKFSPLIDPFNRKITYLRVSVTDRCDFRCVYCMSEKMQFLPKKDLLTLEELDNTFKFLIEHKSIDTKTHSCQYYYYFIEKNSIS